MKCTYYYHEQRIACCDEVSQVNRIHLDLIFCKKDRCQIVNCKAKDNQNIYRYINLIISYLALMSQHSCNNKQDNGCDHYTHHKSAEINPEISYFILHVTVKYFITMSVYNLLGYITGTFKRISVKKSIRNRLKSRIKRGCKVPETYDKKYY